MKIEHGTKDIYLAAVWLSKGAEFERADRTDLRHQIFYFSVPEKLSALLDLAEYEKEWVNETIEGNLYKFSKALQRMKSIIHSE